MSIYPAENTLYSDYMVDIHKKQLTDLFFHYYKTVPTELRIISPHASDRTYYRILSGNYSCIGTYSAQTDINQNFFKISKRLIDAKIPCARVLSISKSGDYYLQEDLGPHNALEYINEYPERVQAIHEQSLCLAARMHEQVVFGCDDSPTPASQVILEDMKQFITAFIEPLFAQVPEGLTQELERIHALFMEIPVSQYSFVHRDFQLRNLVVNEIGLSVVDFQNALYAPSAYDIASLLFSSRIDLTTLEIDRLIEKYSTCIKQKQIVDLRKQVYVTALCRVLQALASYGRVGIKGNKKQFLESIAKAQKNLTKVILVLQRDYQELFPVLANIAHESLVFPKDVVAIPVELISFSYARKQMPLLHPRHINLVFDARLFSNPGRDAMLKSFTGKDKVIQDFVSESEAFIAFTDTITATIKSIYQSNYAYSAPITKMCVYIGCTGGRHRSVASVELVAQKLVSLGYIVSKHHINICA